jgi:hypothetical protein
MIGVLVVVLAVAVPDLLACGDKFLIAGRGTRFQRPKNARAASVLIYAAPASAMAATIKKAKTESLLKLDGHHVTKVQTLQELSTIVSTGRFDVILTPNGDSANVRALLQASPDASAVVGIDDLVKDHSAIDKAVLQRDKNLKERDQNLKKKALKR